MTATPNYVYANFFKRFVAVLIDGIILLIFNFIAFGREPQQSTNPQAIVYYISTTVVAWLYFALMESSLMQATFGKKILAIAVTDSEGKRVSFGRATARYFGKIIWALIIFVGLFIVGFAQIRGANNSLYSFVAGLLIIVGFLILIIGYLMALFTPEKQALHDIMARCLILDDRGQSVAVPWRNLVIVAVVAIVLGRGVSPQLFGNIIPTPTPNPTESTSPPPTSSEIPSNPNIPSQVITQLQGLTLDNIEITNLSTPRTLPNICGEALQILQPSDSDKQEFDWKLNWTHLGEAYVARLKIQGHSGRMRVVFLDGQGNLKTVDQTMQLYTSARGYILLGFNPIDVETQELRKEYHPDNIIYRRELDRSITIRNCDDGGSNLLVTFENFQ